MEENETMKIIKKIVHRLRLNIRRAINRRTAYAYPPENGGWVKYSDPLIGNKTEGIFYDPFVRQINGKYIMFVSHRNTKSIVRMESIDGIHWSKPVTVLSGNAESSWEQRVSRASFVYRDGYWYLWYTGMNARDSKIGLAISKDGYHFERYSGNPIIVPSEIFEKNAVMNPCVVWDSTEKLFKMWYSAGEKFEPDVLCFAVSKDGYSWTKYFKNPIFTHGKERYDKKKVGGCDIVKLNGEYVQFYIGYENIDNARICIARSLDGITWNRANCNPILAPTENGWDSDAVYKPSVCYNEMEGVLYLWYNGRKGHNEYIGLATKKYKEGKEELLDD